MAKSVGSPDREHSVLSSPAKGAGMIGDHGRAYHLDQRRLNPSHKQVAYMTAPSVSPNVVTHTLRNRGRPYMTEDGRCGMIPTCV